MSTSWSWLLVSALVTKSALRPPVTRCYPLQRRVPFARTRGHIRFKVDNCTFCTVCAVKCPTGAIVAHKKERVWAIDHSRCILCGICVEDCREGCITLGNDPLPPLQLKDLISIRQDYAPPERGSASKPAPEVPPPQRRGVKGGGDTAPGAS